MALGICSVCLKQGYVETLYGNNLYDGDERPLMDICNGCLEKACMEKSIIEKVLKRYV